MATSVTSETDCLKACRISDTCLAAEWRISVNPGCTLADGFILGTNVTDSAAVTYVYNETCTGRPNTAYYMPTKRYLLCALQQIQCGNIDFLRQFVIDARLIFICMNGNAYIIRYWTLTVSGNRDEAYLSKLYEVLSKITSIRKRLYFLMPRSLRILKLSLSVRSSNRLRAIISWLSDGFSSIVFPNVFHRLVLALSFSDGFLEYNRLIPLSN